MAIHLLDRSFSSGELTPELFGRVDFAKFQSGLALCRNFITLPHGPAINRAGTEFVSEVKNSAVATRLIPFSYNSVQTFAIEVGAGYFRWHTQGANLLYTTPAAWVTTTAYAVGDMASNGGTNYYCTTAHTSGTFATDLAAGKWYALPSNPNIYEIPNPYAAADLMDIHYVQSSDVLTLVHPNYPPKELRRLGAQKWTLNTISFAPGISPPVAVVTSGTPINHTYVVTAMVPDPSFVSLILTSATSMPLLETLQSATASASNDLTITGAFNTISWAPLTDAKSYRVYKLIGGVYAYLGDSSSTSFTDDRTRAADTGRNPPSTGATGPTGVGCSATTATLSTVNATATGTGSTSYSYVVTSVPDTGLESIASSVASCTNNLLTAGNYNTISWPSVPGAVRYNIYKNSNGLYGYIGQAAGNSFVDNNITADVSRTPPISSDPFAAVGERPGAVSYYEQRRVFAGSTNKPQNVWATRSGTESDMSYTIPTRDDNRLAFRIAAREASAIRHIVPVAQLIVLTASGEWRVASTTTDALTPTTINAKQQSYYGANNVTPVVVGGIVIYASARGGHIREMSYNWQANSYLTNDISLLAPHLFDYNNILDMAYSRGPVPILWGVSSNGNLLGLTYVTDQQVAAWHHHDTGNGDVFEAICVISETPANSISAEDMLYAIVRRTINGATKRYVERLHTRLYATLADAFFVDCGATYSGAATTTVTGLTWLEGRTVNILADGAVSPPQVVTGGTVTLPQAASKITVGLPIQADLQTLPVAAQVDPALAQGRPKNVNRVWMRTYRSSGVLAGPSFSKLVPYKQRTSEPYGSPPNMVSDEIEIALSPQWGRGGQVCVRQNDPLPLDIASMTLEVALGGG